MSRNLFVTDETVKINLDESDYYVEVRKDLTFEQFQSIYSDFDEKNPIANAMPLLKKAITGWNFKKGEDGEVMEVNDEAIEKLSPPIVFELIEKCMPLYMPEKKKLECIRAVITRGNKAKYEEVADELLDYSMAEKFGLDWKQGGSVRVKYLIAIFSAVKEKERIDNEKAEQQNRINNLKNGRR